MIKERLFANFAHPRGVLGRVAGRIMAVKRDNVERARWALAELAPAKDARVLELGYGPGVALMDTCTRAERGQVFGVDISPVMRAQAGRRNARFVRDGVLDLRVGDAQHLDADLDALDLIYGVNVWQFWTDQGATIAELRSRLAPEGRLALVYMRPPSGTTTTHDAEARLQKQFADAGFAAVETKTMDRTPPAVMIIGHR
jgi:SAM-dependent methyltransferase